MPSNKYLSPAKRRARDREIYARFLRGATPQAIVDELQTTPAVVNRAIRRGEEETARRFADREAVRLQQSEQLRLIYGEALAAWEESKKGNEVTKISTAAEGEETGKRRAEKTTRKQAGDPRFLSQAMSALADLRRLWRLEAPAPEAAHNAGAEQEILSIQEDERWYGNDAHDLAAQTVAASAADPAVARPLQGGRLWPPLG